MVFLRRHPPVERRQWPGNVPSGDGSVARVSSRARMFPSSAVADRVHAIQLVCHSCNSSVQPDSSFAMCANILTRAAVAPVATSVWDGITYQAGEKELSSSYVKLSPSINPLRQWRGRPDVRQNSGQLETDKRVLQHGEHSVL